jgi:hypothetical protein
MGGAHGQNDGRLPVSVDLVQVFTVLGTVGGLGGIYGLVRVRGEMRKLQAEASSITEDATQKAVTTMSMVLDASTAQMQRQVDRLEIELARERDALDKVRDEAAACQAQRDTLAGRLDSALEALQGAFDRIAALEEHRPLPPRD